MCIRDRPYISDLIWDRKETKSATFYYKFNSSVLLRRSHYNIDITAQNLSRRKFYCSYHVLTSLVLVTTTNTAEYLNVSIGTCANSAQIEAKNTPIYKNAYVR